MVMGCVYKAVNKINGKIYIGKTIFSLDKRKKEHIFDSGRANGRYQQYFHRAIAKYGEDNFVWEVIFESDDEDELLLKEQEYISIYKTGYSLYNLTEGGEGISGFSFSSDSKEKMSMTQNRIRKTKEWKEKMSEATRKSLKNNPEHLKRFHEGTIKMLKDKWKDPEYIAWQKKRSQGGNNPAAVKINCVETGEVFGCIMDAARKYNRSEASIREVLDRPNRTSAKLHWKRAA